MSQPLALAALEAAQPIGTNQDTGRAPRFSCSFALETTHGTPELATLRATAHGIFEATLNHRPVSDDLFAPGWTDYNARLQVFSWDVTALLAEHNSLQIVVGNGWWRGDLGAEGLNVNYGGRLALLASVEIEYTDGFVQRITTGPDWTVTASAIVSNNIYDGQTVDFTLQDETWEVAAVELDKTTLVEAISPPIRRQETIAPVRMWPAASGATIVDFGQNLVGWVRLRCPGDRGRTIRVRHAEILIDGELATAPLRGAAATDTITLGDQSCEFEPTFTYHGFRYAEITGWHGEPTAEDVTAVVVHSDLTRRGHFECSDERVNQLVTNAIWSQRGNFFSIPTDCPQRDERLGWTGDIAVFAPSALFTYDAEDFLHSWLGDVRTETQATGGLVPLFVPNIIKQTQIDSPELRTPYAIWGDAAVWVPQALWHASADLGRLTEHYPAMRMHLEGIIPRLSPTGLWDTGFQLGDWLDPDAPPDQPMKAKADPGVIATACLYRSAAFVADAARLLNYAEDARRYQQLADRTREAFNAHYVSPTGRITSDCATVYALAIHFGLLDADIRASAGDRLAELVRADDFRIPSGFAGTPYLTWALSETNHLEDAYALVMRRRCPSWLYMVDQGATTMWERWDSLRPDGTLNPGEMTSFNHYALGAIVDWLVQVVGGIRPAQPGFAEIRFAPRPGGGLQWARTSYRSQHGDILCSWHIERLEIVVELTVPAGVQATLSAPDGREYPVGAGTSFHRIPLPVQDLVTQRDEP